MKNTRLCASVAFLLFPCWAQCSHASSDPSSEHTLISSQLVPSLVWDSCVRQVTTWFSRLLWCLLGSGHPVHGAAIRPLVSPWFWTPSAWCCYTAFGVSLVLDTQCMVLIYGLWCLLGHPVHCVAIGSLVCYIIWPLVSPWFWTPCAWCCYRAFCVLYGLWCLLGSGHPVDSAAVGRFRQGC